MICGRSSAIWAQGQSCAQTLSGAGHGIIDARHEVHLCSPAAAPGNEGNDEIAGYPLFEQVFAAAALSFLSFFLAAVFRAPLAFLTLAACLVTAASALVQAFETVDALLTPTTPSAAFALGAKDTMDPVTMYLNDVFTVTANLAGLPAMSLPAGLDSQGLPLGLQLIGRPLQEGTLFSVAGALEKAADFKAKPGVWWRE